MSIEEWLEKRERLYSSVIPGVLDSGELADMRRLINMVRAYRKATRYVAERQWTRDTVHVSKWVNDFVEVCEIAEKEALRGIK